MGAMLMREFKLLDSKYPHPPAGKMTASRRPHGPYPGYDNIEGFQRLPLDVIQGREFPPPGNQPGVIQFMAKHCLGITSFRLDYPMVIDDT